MNEIQLHKRWNITTILVVAIALIMIASLLVFMSISDTDAGKIRIGVSTALTGQAAFIGTPYLEGLKIAQKEINDNGGIRGKKIEIDAEDNKNIAKEGITTFYTLQTRDPDLMITTMSTPSIAIANLANQSDVPLFVSIVFADVLSKNTNAVSFFPTTSDDVKATLDDMLQGEVKSVSILYIDSEYGKASADAFSKKAQENHISILRMESYLGEANDYATPLSKILADKPQGIYLATVNPIPPIDYIKNSEQNVSIYTNLIPLFGSLVYKDPEAFEGVHLTAPKVSIPGTEEYQMLRSKISTIANKSTLGYTFIAYQNMYAISKVLEKNPDAKQFVPTFSDYGLLDGIGGPYNLSGRNIGLPLYPVIFTKGDIRPVDGP